MTKESISKIFESMSEEDQDSKETIKAFGELLDANGHTANMHEDVETVYKVAVALRSMDSMVAAVNDKMYIRDAFKGTIDHYLHRSEDVCQRVMERIRTGEVYGWNLTAGESLLFQRICTMDFFYNFNKAVKECMETPRGIKPLVDFASV